MYLIGWENMRVLDSIVKINLLLESRLGMLVPR